MDFQEGALIIFFLIFSPVSQFYFSGKSPWLNAQLLGVSY